MPTESREHALGAISLTMQNEMWTVALRLKSCPQMFFKYSLKIIGRSTSLSWNELLCNFQKTTSWESGVNNCTLYSGNFAYYWRYYLVPGTGVTRRVVWWGGVTHHCVFRRTIRAFRELVFLISSACKPVCYAIFKSLKLLDTFSQPCSFFYCSAGPGRSVVSWYRRSRK